MIFSLFIYGVIGIISGVCFAQVNRQSYPLAVLVHLFIWPICLVMAIFSILYKAVVS